MRLHREPEQRPVRVRPRVAADPSLDAAAQVLRLQRLVGNRGVSGILGDEPDEGKYYLTGMAHGSAQHGPAGGYLDEREPGRHRP